MIKHKNEPNIFDWHKQLQFPLKYSIHWLILSRVFGIQMKSIFKPFNKKERKHYSNLQSKCEFNK